MAERVKICRSQIHDGDYLALLADSQDGSFGDADGRSVMTRVERIEKRLAEALKVKKIVARDISESHRGHKGFGRESHIAILVVAEDFRGRDALSRQRLLHRLLKEEWGRGLHALDLKLLTPEEEEKG